MDTEKQALVERWAAVADRMAAQNHKTAMEGWSEIELTLPQLRALGFLAQGPHRMGDLAAFLGGSLSSATNLVERLEGKGLAERAHDTHDRRVVICRLTPEGRVLIDRFWRMQRTHLETVAVFLSVEELATIVGAMELLAAALEREAGARRATVGPEALAARG